MYEEIIENLRLQLSKKELYDFENKQIHLGIFTEPCLTYMLNGKKTIESRFSKNKIMLFEKITKDDIVLIKKSGGNIVAYFTIKEILFFDLQKNAIEKIKAKYNKALCVDDSFWEKKKDSRYATLIKIDKLVELKPFSIHKKGMQTWILLQKDIEENW